MYCSNCGKKLSESARFCSHCGASINVHDEAVHSNDVALSNASLTNNTQAKTLKKYFLVSLPILLILISALVFSIINSNESDGSNSNRHSSSIKLTAENFSEYFMIKTDIGDLETRFEWDTLDNSDSNSLYYQQRAKAKYYITIDTKKDLKCEDVVVKGEITITDRNFKTTTPISVEIEISSRGYVEFTETIDSTNKMAYTTKSMLSNGSTISTVLGQPITLPDIDDIEFEITSITGKITPER